MEIPKGFKEEELTDEQVRYLRNLARLGRADVLRMTHLAATGHPAGALSSMDLFVTLLAVANVVPNQPDEPDRDRVVVSHGHSAPGLYAALGRLDFFDLDDAVSLFCKAGSVFEGTPDRAVPGVEWTAGGVGMGLSAACGLAVAGKLRGLKHNTFVVMSDGEQQKGQTAEARRFAKKYRLNNITALIDDNGMQSIGRTTDVVTQNVKYEYIADGWDVIEINGHEPNEIYKALRRAMQIQSAPVLVLAHTTLGSGVSFMEGNPEYHGRPLTEAEYVEAMRELRVDPALDEQADYRDAFGAFDLDIPEPAQTAPVPEVGEAVTYPPGEAVPLTEVLGRTLQDVGERNRDNAEAPVALVDCGAAPLVGTSRFARENRGAYFQFGLQDHAAATTAGAMSLGGVVAVWASVGVHGLDGAYGQLRINDINRANLKMIFTHLGVEGLDEGRALQNVDYLSLLDNLAHCRAVFPADPNQADRVLRAVLAEPGNWVVGVGSRSAPVITDLDGNPVFAGDYRFAYGRVDLIRPGDHGVILTTGAMLGRAVQAWEVLREEAMEPTVLHVPCPAALEGTDDPLVLQSLRKGRVITYEDHNVRTGLGSRVANIIAVRGVSCRLLKLGVEGYGIAGVPDDVLLRLGLDVDTLVARALKFLKR